MTPAPWERRRDEGARAFEAFAYYRDLGPQRSLAKVRQNLGKTPAYLRQIETWSSRHAWVERATRWDEEQDRLHREAQQTALDEMRRRQVAAATQYQAALSLPAQTVMERLARRDPALLEALNEMNPEDLLRLVALCARAQKAPVAIEWGARGYVPAAPLDSADVADREDERALEELLERIRTVEPLGASKAKKERAMRRAGANSS